MGIYIYVLVYSLIRVNVRFRNYFFGGFNTATNNGKSKNKGFFDGILDAIDNFELFGDGKSNKPPVELGCDINSSAETLMGCLVDSMKSFEGDMMVCVDRKDFEGKEANLRYVARKHGVSLSIRKNATTKEIPDALCLTVSKADRLKLKNKLGRAGR